MIIAADPFAGPAVQSLADWGRDQRPSNKHVTPGGRAMDLYELPAEVYVENIAEVAEFAWVKYRNRACRPAFALGFAAQHDGHDECAPPTWGRRCHVRLTHDRAAVIEIRCIGHDDDAMAAVYEVEFVGEVRWESAGSCKVVGPIGGSA